MENQKNKNRQKEEKIPEKTENIKTEKGKFGAFMEILPGKEGLLHISEISPERVEKVEDVLSVGDVFKVRVISMEGGKISLSKKKV